MISQNQTQTPRVREEPLTTALGQASGLGLPSAQEIAIGAVRDGLRAAVEYLSSDEYKENQKQEAERLKTEEALKKKREDEELAAKLKEATQSGASVSHGNITRQDIERLRHLISSGKVPQSSVDLINDAIAYIEGTKKKPGEEPKKEDESGTRLARTERDRDRPNVAGQLAERVAGLVKAVRGDT